MSTPLAKAIQDWHLLSKNNSYSSLARRVGVSPQTISKWASGVAAPSAEYERRLRDIFTPVGIIPLNQDNVTNSNVTLMTDCRTAMDLPLRLLDPETFEYFCKDLFCLSGDPDMEKFGVSGDSQFGIDLFSPTTRTIIQCKQTSSSTFVLSSVKSTIDLYSQKIDSLEQELGFSPSRKILAVTANLSAKSQLFARNNGWEYLTIHDLTDKVRALPKSNQVSLLEKYFQNNRSQIAKDCLGFKDISFCIMDPMRYFDKIEKQAFEYYSLSNPFVESGSKLAEFIELASSLIDADKRSRIEPVLLEGYEGMGKTRLLKEFCIKRQDLKICVLADSDRLSDDDMRCIVEHDAVIIDDADARTDTIRRLITASFSIDSKLHQKKMPVLLLATNPIGISSLRELFSEFNISIEERIVEIKGNPSCLEIASSLLGNEFCAAPVVQKTCDNPFLTVSASLWLSDPNNSNKNLDAFSVAKIYLEKLERYGSGLSRRGDLARMILQFISILQPLVLDTEFAELVKRYTGESDLEINTTIDKLLGSQLLQKRFGKVSIAPSLLGPFICRELLSTSLVKNCDFFESVLCSGYRNAVIINLAKLPESSKDDSSEYINRAWRSIKDAFDSANNKQKANILKDLSPIAFYQPKEMLKLTEEAVAICRNKANSGSVGDLQKYTIASLECVAHDSNYLDCCIELLLSLPSSNDDRDPLLAAIKELLSPNLFKPVGYRLRVVNSVINHLSVTSNKNAIIKILCKSLDNNSHTCISNGKALTYFYSERDNSDSESPKIIKTLIRLFDNIINTGSMPEKITAIDMLGNIAHYYVRSPILSREKDEVLGRLSNVCLNYESEEIIIAKAFLNLQRCKSDFSDEEWQKITAVTKNVSILLSIFIIDPYWHDLFSYERDYDARQKILRGWFDDSAKKILAAYEDTPSDFYTDVKTFRKHILECGIYCDDRLVLAKVCDVATTSFNRALVDVITAVRSRDVCYPIQALLTKGEEDYCLEYLKQQSDIIDNSSIISSTLISCFDSIEPSRALEFIDCLLRTGDYKSIEDVVFYSGRLIERDESIFPSLITSFSSSKDPTVSHRICELLHASKYKRMLSSLSVDTINSILKPLEEANELDYYILSFLDALSNLHIESVIDFLFARSEKEKNQSFDFSNPVFYYGMPYRFKLNLSKDSLWKCIDLILSKIDSGCAISSGNLRKLLKALALDRDDISETISGIICHRFIASNSSSTLIISNLLGLYKMDYILEDYERIESIVGSIVANYNIDVSAILDSFDLCFIATSKSRTPGEPCEYDLELKDLCNKALCSIPGHFYIRDVFVRAKSYAEQEIARDKKMDEEWGY